MSFFRDIIKKNGDRLEIFMMNSIPEWFVKSSIYQINPRTFSAEGTIEAVTRELPKLRELGFKIMYLCPVFREDDSEDKAFWSERQLKSATENPKNPYRMNDYFDIDEEYGSMADLKRFVESSHELGMKVLLDLVYLHIGPNADILKIHPEFAAKNPDGTAKLTRWHFPYLNYECEGLREYLWSNMTYYVGVIGADGFRCDVGDDVPLDFWCEGKRRITAIKPDAVMINEGVRPEYLSVFHANYTFWWHDCVFQLLEGSITADALITRDEAEKYRVPLGKRLLRDMDNHDTVTDWPYRIEGHYGSDAMELILALNFTLDGVPMVFCGNELADCARLSMFANRFHMGEFEVTDRSSSGAATERRKRVIRTLNEFRESISALNSGATVWHRLDKDRVLSFDRAISGEAVRFVGNFSGEAVEVPDTAFGEVILSNNAERTEGVIRLSSYGYIILLERE